MQTNDPSFSVLATVAAIAIAGSRIGRVVLTLAFVAVIFVGVMS